MAIITAARVVSRITLGFAAARIEVAARATPSRTRVQAAWLFIVATIRTRIADADPSTAMAMRATFPIGCAAHSSRVVMVDAVIVSNTSAGNGKSFRPVARTRDRR